MATGQVSRFALVFDVDGNWETALEQLPNLFNNASNASDQFATRVTDASQRASTAMEAFGRMQEIGTGMMRAGASYFGAMKSTMLDAMGTLMPMEATMTRIKSLTKASKDATLDIIENALVLSERTPFESQSVVDLTAALAVAKVELGAVKDAATGMDATIASMQKAGFANVGQEALNFAGDMKVTRASLLADLATMSGVAPDRMQFFVRGMQRALMTGNLRMLDEIPRPFRKEIWETLGNTAKVPAQKAMDNLYKFLAKKGQIGAALAASTSMGAMLQTFGESKGLLYRKIFGKPDEGGYYDKFKGILADFITTVMGTFNDPKFLNSVKGAVEPIVSFLEKLAKVLSRVVKGALEFIKNHPKLVKFLTLFVTFAAAALTVAGAILAAIGALGLLVITAKVAIVGLVMIKGALIGIAIVGAKVIAVMAALAAIGYAVSKAYESNWGGVRDIIDGVALVFQGLYEGIANMTTRTTTLSDETAKGLAKLGLLEFVMDLLSVANSIYVFFKSIKDGFMSAFGDTSPTINELNEALLFLWDEIKLLFTEIGKLVGANVNLNSEWSETSNIGGMIGVVFGTIVGVTIRLVEWLVILVGGVVRVATWFVKTMQIANAFLNPLSMMVDYVKSLWKGFNLLLEGDISGAFKEWGLGILNFVLTPVQLLIRGIVALLDLVGKEAPKVMQDIGKYGVRSLIETPEEAGRQAWKVPEALKGRKEYEGLTPETVMLLEEQKKRQAYFAQQDAMATPTAAAEAPLASMPDNVLMFPQQAAVPQGEVVGINWAPQVPESVNPIQNNVIPMVPQADLQKRGMAHDQVSAIQGSGWDQRQPQQPINVSMPPAENHIHLSIDGDELASHMESRGGIQSQRVVGG